MTDKGWRPDPKDPRKLRFWDGNEWTDFTKPNPDASSAAQSSQPAFGESPAPGPVRLPGHRNDSSASPAADPYAASGRGQQAHDPYAQTQPRDPYAQAAPNAQDPYAQTPDQAAPGQNWGTPPPAQAPGNAPHDPYAAGASQQPGYVQQPGQQGVVGAVNRFNDSIAQGYGDQSFGGQMSGPAGHRPAEAGRSVFTEKTLVVSQKRKVIEITNEYTVYAADGSTLGAVVQVGQSGMRKAIRLMTNYDQFLTHKLEVRDNQGQVLLQLTRPAKVMKSSVIVQDPQGREIGRLVQRNMFGKIKFGIEAGGQEIGSLNAENWRAWDFAMLDAHGTEVARVTKTWEGLLTTMFTTADNYAVNIHYDLPEPLKSLCIAAALTIDTALKQDERG